MPDTESDGAPAPPPNLALADQFAGLIPAQEVANFITRRLAPYLDDAADDENPDDSDEDSQPEDSPHWPLKLRGFSAVQRNAISYDDPFQILANNGDELGGRILADLQPVHPSLLNVRDQIWDKYHYPVYISTDFKFMHWLLAEGQSRSERAGFEAATQHIHSRYNKHSKWNVNSFRDNFNDIEHVFIPIGATGKNIEENQHSTLLVISPREKLIEFFDSHSGRPGAVPWQTYINGIVDWLMFELGDKFVYREWHFAHGQSTNAYNVAFGHGRGIARYTRPQIQQKKLRVAADIANGVEKGWPPFPRDPVVHAPSDGRLSILSPGKSAVMRRDNNLNLFLDGAGVWGELDNGDAHRALFTRLSTRIKLSWEPADEAKPYDAIVTKGGLMRIVRARKMRPLARYQRRTADRIRRAIYRDITKIKYKRMRATV